LSEKKESETEISRTEEAKISMKWESIKGKNNALEMSEELNKQKKLYEEILLLKENMINTLNRQKEDKANMYYNELKRQRIEIGLFICFFGDMFSSLFFFNFS
jgi:hypothetical protein